MALSFCRDWSAAAVLLCCGKTQERLTLKSHLTEPVPGDMLDYTYRLEKTEEGNSDLSMESIGGSFCCLQPESCL